MGVYTTRVGVFTTRMGVSSTRVDVSNTRVGVANTLAWRPNRYMKCPGDPPNPEKIQDGFVKVNVEIFSAAVTVLSTPRRVRFLDTLLCFLDTLLFPRHTNVPPRHTRLLPRHTSASFTVQDGFVKVNVEIFSAAVIFVY